MFPASVKLLYLPAPTGGINQMLPEDGLRPNEATALTGVDCYPSYVSSFKDASQHITSDFSNEVFALHPYSPVSGSATLWATTGAGVYNVTSSGAPPAASIALTNGKTIGAVLSTGAQNYLTLVNGTDSMVQYNGAAWSSIATVGGGAINTNTFSYVETYRQRTYFVVAGTTRLVYLTANSASGGGTTYDTAAIFRRGGAVLALATWTIDGGTGPDDHLCILTTEGEIAVFTGNDPASWTYKGTYYVGRPAGKRPMLKFGGDLLYLAENGIYPLSRSLLVATLDRSAAITNKINPTFVTSMSTLRTEWAVHAAIDYARSKLVVNAVYGIWAMDTQSGAWSNWNFSNIAGVTAQTASGMAFFEGSMYYASGLRVFKQSGSGTASPTMYSGWISPGGARTSRILAVRPVITMNASSGDMKVKILRNRGGAGTPVSQSSTIVGTTAGFTNESWIPVTDNYSTWKQLRFDGNGSTAVNFTYRGCHLAYVVGNRFGAWQ